MNYCLWGKSLNCNCQNSEVKKNAKVPQTQFVRLSCLFMNFPPNFSEWPTRHLKSNAILFEREPCARALVVVAENHKSAIKSISYKQSPKWWTTITCWASIKTTSSCPNPSLIWCEIQIRISTLLRSTAKPNNLTMASILWALVCPIKCHLWACL